MNNDIDILARTLYGEARGEDYDGKCAVANTIINRFKSKKWYAGDTIADTCLKKWQYSCWAGNYDEAHRKNYESLMKVSESDKVFKECLDIAKLACEDCLVDITDGCTHYCTKAVKDKTSWAKDIEPHKVIGNHLFFKGVA